MIEVCKLCGKRPAEGPKSHVIPSWMYSLLPQDERRFCIVTSYPGEFQQRSKDGIYGQFVCKACEDKFGIWDDYAAKLLKKQPKQVKEGWDYGNYHYGNLMRFYLSVFWRISACGHKFFEAVDINSRNATLASALLSEDDKVLSEFDVWPSISFHPLALGVMTPIEVEIESVPYWQLYMPKFQALIKVSAQSGAPCIQPYKLKPNSQLFMQEKDFTEFSEIEMAEKTIKENWAKKHR